MREVKGHVRTILALPRTTNDLPARMRSNWPKYIREYILTYNTDAARSELHQVTRYAPSPKAIDEALAFAWWSLQELEEAERVALWGVACKAPAEALAYKLRCSKATIWRLRNIALDRYAASVALCSREDKEAPSIQARSLCVR